MKETKYIILNYHNQKIKIFYINLQEIKNFVITEFIPNEMLYSSNGYYISYKKIEELSESKEAIDRIVNIIENENILITRKPNDVRHFQEQYLLEYKLKDKKSNRLSSQEIQKRIIEYKTTDDKSRKKQIQEEIILSSIHNINYLLYKYRNLIIGTIIDVELIHDSCYETILKCMNNYKLDSNVLFNSYMITAIKRNIIRTFTKLYLENSCELKKYIIEELNKALINYEITLQELFADEFLLEEFKQYIIDNMPEKIKKEYKNINEVVTLLLNKINSLSLDETEVYENSDFFEETDNNILKEQLDKIMTSILSAKEIDILKKYYYENKRLEDICASYGITPERVRQIKVRALRKLTKKRLQEIYLSLTNTKQKIYERKYEEEQ